jgi:DnaJ-class molecular chaperone
MFTPVVTCGKCNGRGFRPFFGPLFLECRHCKGSGHVMKTSARLLHMIRFGTGGED